jgi:hypothetical protein
LLLCLWDLTAGGMLNFPGSRRLSRGVRARLALTSVDGHIFDQQ